MYKTGGNSGMFFLDLPYFFYSGFRIFWGAFPAFLSERVRFSHLPIRFFKRVFYLVGYDSLVSFPSVCLILRILLIKNPFFFRMNHPSGYASFLFSSGYFHIFSDAPADFSVLPRILFCIFSVRLRKNLLLFPCETEKFFHLIPVFCMLLLNIFKGKILIFRNEFSVRTNIFSFSRGVFSDFFRVIR